MLKKCIILCLLNACAHLQPAYSVQGIPVYLHIDDEKDEYLQYIDVQTMANYLGIVVSVIEQRTAKEITAESIEDKLHQLRKKGVHLYGISGFQCPDNSDRCTGFYEKSKGIHVIAPSECLAESDLAHEFLHYVLEEVMETDGDPNHLSTTFWKNPSSIETLVKIYAAINLCNYQVMVDSDGGIYLLKKKD